MLSQDAVNAKTRVGKGVGVGVGALQAVKPLITPLSPGTKP
jgi:hypothetical protein